MSIAVCYERFILTANKLRERILSSIDDKGKVQLPIPSGGRA
jgi:hypothetical protein